MNLLPLERLQNKIFSQKREFKRFENISSEKFKELLIKAIAFNKKKIIYNYHCASSQELYFYTELLQYLTKPNIFEEFSSFDEKILFLIFCIDPECIIYRSYLKQENKNWTIKVREQIGICDKKLLVFEKEFVNKYFLVTEVNIDHSRLLLLLSKNIQNFNDIDDISFNKIKEILICWQEIPNNQKDYKTSAYNVLYQSRLLNLNGIKEKIIFFIMSIDPNLRMLQIYNDECMIERIEKACIDEFGFYSQELIRLESLYHSKFCHDLEIDTWTKQKKKLFSLI